MLIACGKYFRAGIMGAADRQIEFGYAFPLLPSWEDLTADNAIHVPSWRPRKKSRSGLNAREDAARGIRIAPIYSPTAVRYSASSTSASAKPSIRTQD